MNEISFYLMDIDEVEFLREDYFRRGWRELETSYLSENIFDDYIISPRNGKLWSLEECLNVLSGKLVSGDNYQTQALDVLDFFIYLYNEGFYDPKFVKERGLLTE
ncbi:MAG: hypothetical protein ACLFPQ_03485 [Candidatus Woesearchaeota archaeon]